jgi:hypothetical protein
VCPQSPFGVLKNCGMQTNWASRMRFAADHSETLEAFYWPQYVGSLGSTENVQTIFELLPCSVKHVPGHAATVRSTKNWALTATHGKSLNIVWTFSVLPGSPHQGLLRSVKNFQSFTMICRKPHVACSICLHATIFQNPEGTLWTHCIF